MRVRSDNGCDKLVHVTDCVDGVDGGDSKDAAQNVPVSSTSNVFAAAA